MRDDFKARATLACLSLAFAFASCAPSETAEDDAPYMDPSATFAEQPYQYCMQRNERWLIDLMDRVRVMLPPRFDAQSLRYEELNVGTAADDGVIDEKRRELRLHLRAQSNDGEIVSLPTYGVIDPVTCSVDRLETNVGFYRFEESTERFFEPARAAN